MEATYEYFIRPHTLTVLCTYQCTAACRQCCFESSPSVKGKLSAETIKARISEAKREFDSLEMVVFSGGEAFLLKQDAKLDPALMRNTERALRLAAVGGHHGVKVHALREMIAEEVKAVVRAMQQIGLLALDKAQLSTATDAMTRYSYRTLGI